jgi:hypothetical protein
MATLHCAIARMCAVEVLLWCRVAQQVTPVPAPERSKNAILGGFRVQKVLRQLWSVSDRAFGTLLVKTQELKNIACTWAGLNGACHASSRQFGEECRADLHAGAAR